LFTPVVSIFSPWPDFTLMVDP